MSDDSRVEKRRWVWPMRVERRRDAYQRQYILKIWLRWPTYRPYETSTKDSRCVSCGVGAGELHENGCAVLAITLAGGHV